MPVLRRQRFTRRMNITLNNYEKGFNNSGNNYALSPATF